MDDVYRCRLDALEQTWGIWGELGGELTEEQWSRPSRCPGWDVAALYAHYSLFPLAFSTPPAAASPVGELLTADELMKRFNAPNGAAHAMAGMVADGAIAEAAAHPRRELVDRFVVHGDRALQILRSTEPTMVVPWPLSNVVITLVEALRDTVQLLAALVPPVEFIEAATGRSTHLPLPVLR